MLAWAQRWAPVINAVSAAGTALAAIAAAIALWLSWGQLKETQRGLELTNKSLRATTAYQVQKDGRELLSGLVAETDVFNALFGATGTKVSPEEALRLKAQLRTLQAINFYASVYNQRQSGTVDDELWQSFEAEFCEFLKNPQPRLLWVEAVKRGAYRGGFLQRGQACLGP